MVFLGPPLRALEQLDDPAFLGVVWRSILLTLAGAAGLVVLAVWGIHAALSGQGSLAWAAGLLGGAGAALLALYFFLPLAAVVATLFSDRIAVAVEQRFYPFLPPARPAPLATQLWDGLALGLLVLFWQAVTLLLSVIPPFAPIVLPLGWLIAAWAIGRGLFVAVAMRRMDRPQALTLYARLRGAVIAQGALIALASLVPMFNLFVPVLGVAAMVHLLHETPQVDIIT